MKVINGSAAFCVGRPNSDCRDNQGSTPTVNPTTGQLWVGFLNGDTPDEDQYLVVTSTDGGQTFGPPNFVSPIYDINYPRANSTRPDCINRGAQTRSTLTNSCFRVNSYGNIVADRRGGAFADDLYVVLDDNRNGTPASSNVDVFYLRSTDGGEDVDRADAGEQRPLGRTAEPRLRPRSRQPRRGHGRQCRVRRRHRLRERQLVPVDRRQLVGNVERRLLRPPARHGLRQVGVADEPQPARELPDVVLRRDVPHHLDRDAGCDRHVRSRQVRRSATPTRRP